MNLLLAPGLVSRVRNAFTKTGHAGRDFVSGFGPNKGFRMMIGCFDVASDSGLQLPSGVMHATTNLLFSERRKPALHQIQPGSAGGSEVHVKARMARQPAMNQGGFVRRIVVQDQMHIQGHGHRRIDAIQKFSEIRSTDGAHESHPAPVRSSPPGPQTARWCRAAGSHACAAPLAPDAWAAAAANGPAPESAFFHRRTAPTPCPAD